MRTGWRCLLAVGRRSNCISCRSASHSMCSLSRHLVLHNTSLPASAAAGWPTVQAATDGNFLQFVRAICSASDNKRRQFRHSTCWGAWARSRPAVRCLRVICRWHGAWWCVGSLAWSDATSLHSPAQQLDITPADHCSVIPLAEMNRKHLKTDRQQHNGACDLILAVVCITSATLKIPDWLIVALNVNYALSWSIGWSKMSL